MGYLGEDIRKLGFGLMRLPMTDGAIDIEQVKVMVDKFLDAGFTYFDTAYAYPGSEAAIKAALIDRYPRESFQLATKLPAWLGPKNAEEAKQMFFTSLERTSAGYFDYYLLHNLGDTRTDVFDRFDLWNFLLEQREKGLIKHIGFSMHDKADALDEVLTKHPEAEFVQLQINYADWKSESVQSQACFEVAKAYGKPVVIMEPVKGGLLADPPASVAEILKTANPDASCASWALRFAASLDNVITVLSGMSNIEQMDDNIATFTDFKPLDESELAVVDQARIALNAIPSIPCTSCAYCVKECPQGVAIPGIFRAMNTYLIYDDIKRAKGNYGWETFKGGHASECVECGVCESVCPQHIDIIDQLKRAVETFEK